MDFSLNYYVPNEVIILNINYPYKQVLSIRHIVVAAMGYQTLGKLGISHVKKVLSYLLSTLYGAYDKYNKAHE